MFFAATACAFLVSNPNISNTSVSVAQDKGYTAFSEEFEKLISLIDQLMEELAKNSPNKETVHGFLGKLGDWVPDTVRTIVTDLALRVVGL